MVALDDIPRNSEIGLVGDFWVSEFDVQVKTQKGWVPLDNVDGHPALPYSTLRPLYRVVVNSLVYGKHSGRQECFKHWNMHSSADLVDMWERCYNIRLSEECKERVISVRQSVETFSHLTAGQMASLIATIRRDQLADEDTGLRGVAVKARRASKPKPEPQPVLFWWVSSTPVNTCQTPESASAASAGVLKPEPELESAGEFSSVSQTSRLIKLTH